MGCIYSRSLSFNGDVIDCAPVHGFEVWTHIILPNLNSDTVSHFFHSLSRRTVTYASTRFVPTLRIMCASELEVDIPTSNAQTTAIWQFYTVRSEKDKSDTYRITTKKGSWVGVALQNRWWRPEAVVAQTQLNPSHCDSISTTGQHARSWPASPTNL